MLLYVSTHYREWMLMHPPDSVFVGRMGPAEEP